MDELIFIENKKNDMFNIEIYKGFGYEVKIYEWIDGGDSSIVVKPIKSHLQPGISFGSKIEPFLSFNQMSGLLEADVREMFEYTEKAFKLIEKVKANIINEKGLSLM